ncbi:MAG: TonB-dependent receptor, partial [Epsilonproteobacteria bacterium]|nr:TonB-dependent receptor [Campylobacterota bacterium]
DNIQSIKVVKGGASYLFGEDALSGAIIITTKKGYNNYNSVAAEVGSFNYKKLLARAGLSGESYNFYIQASKRASDGYWEDSGYEATYLNSKLQYFIDDTSDITAGLELSQRKKDSHGTVKGVTAAQTNPQSLDIGDGDRDYSRKYDVALGKLFVTYSKDFDANTNMLVNIYQYNDNTEFVSSPIKYDLNGATVTDVDAYGTLNDYFQIQRGLKSELRTSSESFASLLGVDIRDNFYENKTEILQDYCSKINYRTRACDTIVLAGTKTGNDETVERVYALYGELKYALSEALIMTGNARYDHIAMDYTDKLQSISLDKSFDVGSYRIGANYIFTPETSLYSNISTGFRTPTVGQLFAGDLDPTSTKVSNNYDLKPETALSFDIGLRGNHALFDYDATLYIMDRKDYIMANVGQYARVDSTDPASAVKRYENIGGMRSQGLELSLNSTKKEPFFAELAYTYTDAKFTQYDNFNLVLGNPYSRYTVEHYDLEGKYIPRVSKHVANLRFNYNHENRLLTTLEVNARSSYFADELNRLEIAGYEVFNFSMNYFTKINDYKLEAFLRIDNLFDKNYFNTARASGDNNYDGVYDAEDLSITVNPGRVYTAGMSLKF